MGQTDDVNSSQTPASRAALEAIDLLPGGPSLAVDACSSEGLLQQKGQESDAELHLRFADFHENYLRHYIALADTKAGATFTVTSGVLTYLLSSTKLLTAINGGSWESKTLFALVAAALLVASSGFSFFVILPRKNRTQAEGFIYFGTVARLANVDSFVRKVTSTGLVGLVNSRLKHCYDLARICDRKYVWLRRGMIVGVIGLIATSIAIVGN